MMWISSSKRRENWSRIRQIYDLLHELVGRDLKTRYKRSFLGIGWSLLNPLSQTLVFSFLFGTVLPLDIRNYTAFVFTGVLVWSWFNSTMNSAAGSVVGSAELVRRPGFPIAILPVINVASNGIHFLIATPLLILFSLADGGQVGTTLLALPLVAALQACLTLGLSYLVAAIHVRFRDTQHLVGILVMLAFYITPVFYHADKIPPEYRFLYDHNPMAILLTAYRAIVLENRWPDPEALLPVAILSLLSIAIGHRVFQRASARFADEL